MAPQTARKVQLIGVIAIVAIACAGGAVIWGLTHRAKFPLATAAPEAPPPPPVTQPVRRAPAGNFPPNSLEAKFGPERVAVLVCTNASGIGNLRRIVNQHVRALIPAADRAYKYGIWRGTLTIRLAPVDELDILAKHIDFGQITKTDPATRTLTIKLDRAKFANP